jgi:endonuclease YncB( thermonuclease family)
MSWFFGKNKISKIEKIQNNQEKLQKDFLKKATYDSVPFFHLNGYSSWVKVSSLYDGDTCSLIFFLNGRPVKFRCRLAEIDCAEKKSPNPMEVEHAHKALNRFKEFAGCQEKTPDESDILLYAKFHRFDKYGRLLVSLYDDPTSQYSFNDILIGEGLAYHYTGGKRIPFSEWHCDSSSESDHIFSEKIDNVGDTEVFEAEEEPISGDAFIIKSE